MEPLTPDDPRLGLAGHAELVAEDGAWLPCRLPPGAPLSPPGLTAAALMASGVRADFVTDATGLAWQVRVEVPAGTRRAPAPFDIVVDGVLSARVTVEGSGTLAVTGLAPGAKRITVWLPQYGSTRLHRLRLEGATTLEAAPGGPRWTTYGSSITHCTGAEGPSATWPALVAARHGWQLRNLGFARECHLDPQVARFIRDTPADLISICAGVNIHGKASFTRRTLGPALAGFVATVRDGHPDVPLVLLGPITAPDREHQVNSAGLTLADVRDVVAGTAAALREAGDMHLHLVDGRDALGPSDSHLLTDGLHPSAAGYRLMADRLAPLLHGFAADPAAPTGR
ncbi:lipase [Streptomyces sulfonofaciens]|uniref:Lipase n=1 Tax=Streptomyces sulfonofaciens TaxID=68272 RepID=A0A919L7Z0_9ACTN|nr:GDSL-type esterase/lipase family protein [Streptomyces sulfonofaciens]GHH86036.1 lipase [Streptomyces sulfonofaciens]